MCLECFPQEFLLEPNICLIGLASFKQMCAFPLNIFDHCILDVDGRWMVVHKTAAGVHCTANPTRLAHPSSLVRFVGIVTRTRSRCCSKRQRTPVIWSGFIHVQKLQVYRTTRDTCIFSKRLCPCANHLLELFPIIPVVVGYRNTTIIGTREQR